MLFSVIIPAYNRAALLGQTLESALSQEFDDFEVIVVDDGSTDETSRAAHAFRERVRLFRQENKGPGSARNLGIANALGEYVAFLDSDDVWFPWTLSVHARAIDMFRRPSFVSGRGTALDDYDATARSEAPFRADSHTNMLSACQGPMPPIGGTSSIVVSARLLREVGGFAEGLINGEDTDLWLRLGQAPNFVRIQEPEVFAQRYHENSMTRNLDASIRGALFLVTRESAGAYPGGWRFRRRRRQIIAATARNVSLECLRFGQREPAWRLFRATTAWNLWLGRAKYFLAFPVLFVLSLLSSRRISSTAR